MPHPLYFDKKAVQVNRQGVRFNLLLESIFSKYAIYIFIYLSNTHIQFYYPVSQMRRLRPSNK